AEAGGTALQPGRPLCEPPVCGPALLLQSSGTTDTPRIAVRCGASLDAVADLYVRVLRLSPEDHIVACLPLSHSYGMETGLLAPIYAGCHVRLFDGFDAPSVLSGLGTGATVFPGVPFMFEAL